MTQQTLTIYRKRKTAKRPSLEHSPSGTILAPGGQRVMAYPKLPPTPRGGVSKLTKPTVELIVRLIRRGHYTETACALAGIHRSTMANWLMWGKLKPKSKYGAFRRLVLQAEAAAEIRDFENIRRAGDKGIWTASAWSLERRHPQHWGRKDTQIAQSTWIDNRQVHVDTPRLSPEQVAVLRDVLTKTRGLAPADENRVVNASHEDA
jgi:hypothetical protein